jgi:thiosulfate/3-mercaptopyruvate sulfurtransferase
MKTWSYSLIAGATCLLLAQPLPAEEGIHGNLVTVQWLEKHLKDGDVLILDASPRPIYSAKHIPGAVNIDMFLYGLPNMTAAEMEKHFQSWGVSTGKTIVMYDQGGSMTATRIFFSLLYYGFPAKDLLILDGGSFQWEAKGLALTKDSTAAPAPGTFKIQALNEMVKGELPEVLAASGSAGRDVLLEALDGGWHFGQVRAFNKAGHIPNGVLLPSTDFYNSDKTFKSPEEIERMLRYVGIGPEQRIYTYCGGGVAASVPFFALKFILNYPKVKLYVESELGWLADERDLPYWTYDAPSLMRESNWLQFWGGAMLRSIGLERVSLVDVRPADAFSEGHLPFALNIGADVFRGNTSNLAKLGERMGAAGVNIAHEAVVISGAGLTKDAALAFVMLEKLGQRRVSVFMDSMDKWAQLGFAVTKDATVVGPLKTREGTTIPAAAYPVELRGGIVIGDPKETHGSYPKVFIASGSKAPAKAQDGKVIHLPYTDLLNADGTPKAAKDIWSILTKAGVPRYAELVCFADDAGEAAANYFILRLMGYPDVKVLLP